MAMDPELRYDNRDSHTTEIFPIPGRAYDRVDVDPWELFHNMLENLPPKEEWDDELWGDVEDMIDILKNMTH